MSTATEDACPACSANGYTVERLTGRASFGERWDRVTAERYPSRTVAAMAADVYQRQHPADEVRVRPLETKKRKP